MAQEFFPQRVLVSEERSGHYGRASMYALREKDKPERAQRRLERQDVKIDPIRC